MRRKENRGQTSCFPFSRRKKWETTSLAPIFRQQLFVAAMVAWCIPQGFAQDRRSVTEPRIPQSCAVLTASLHSSEGKLALADEAKLDTQRIQAALDSCPSGKAVELKAGPGGDTFLSGPLQLRAGVTLLVDAGVILFAS